MQPCSARGQLNVRRQEFPDECNDALSMADQLPLKTMLFTERRARHCGLDSGPIHKRGREPREHVDDGGPNGRRKFE